MASAITDSRLERMFIIHSHLRKGGNYSAEDLAKQISEQGPETNDRTVKADIKFMREMGAPIPMGSKTAKFYYEKPFSILSVTDRINFDETDEAIEYFNQLYKEIPKLVFLQLDQLFLAFQHRVKLMDKAVIGSVQFDEVAYTGQDKIGDLIRYILEKRTITFNYQPFEEEVKVKTVYPYLLKEYNKRWFLIGLDGEIKNLQTYALDRMVSRALPSRDVIVPVGDLNPAALFDQCIGVSLEGKPEKVSVFISNPRAKYVSTKPWHKSQVEEQAENGSRFDWNVMVNRELRAKILEHLPDIEVQEPASLKNWLKEVLEKAMGSCS
jgi:predicted DNA-binding transcriptional regulator YafY